MKQMRKVMATVYLAYVAMRWKILHAPMIAEVIVDSPGCVSTMSAAPRAASVAPATRLHSQTLVSVEHCAQLDLGLSIMTLMQSIGGEQPRILSWPLH